MRAAVVELKASGRGGHTIVEDVEVRERRGGARHQLFTWGGGLHALPHNFVLAIGMDLPTLINLWHVGTTHPHVPPLKYAKARDFPKPKVRYMSGILSQMKKLMVVGVERAGRLRGFDFDGGVTSTQRANELFELVQDCFPKTSKGHKRGVTWKTIFNQWVKEDYQLKHIDYDE